MKTRPSLLLAGLCAVGLPLGFAARKITAASPGTTPAISAQSAGAREDGRAVGALDVEIPHRKSADTAASLLALEPGELCPRLAAWLGDAAEPEIAAFWKDFARRTPVDEDAYRLIFLAWALLDPRAAIAAAPGVRYPWWAWAAHDPAAALAAAAESGAPERVAAVARGIGEFHMDWLRDHYDELSPEVLNSAQTTLGKWNGGRNPMEAMDFMRKIGTAIPAETFKALILQDPWAAFDWIGKHPSEQYGRRSLSYEAGDPGEFLGKTLVAERPEDLERLATLAPSGMLKLKLESAIFANLLATDPDAALASAKSTKFPVAAAERFATLGLGTVKSDPDRAFDLAAQLFTACPEALQNMTRVTYPHGGEGHDESIVGVGEFVNELAAQDPQRAVEMAAGLVGSAAGSTTFRTFADKWAGRDFPAYVDWVNRQTDATVRYNGADIVANRLQAQGNYAESAEWIGSMKPESQNNRFGVLLASWERADPAAAAAWLDQSELPADSKVAIEKQRARYR